MPTPDDEKFEHYLSEFKPVLADPLPVGKRRPVIWRWWAIALPASAALAVCIVLIFVLHLRQQRAGSHVAKGPAGATAADQIANSQPLTLGRASELLTRAPSFQAALDNVAFQRQRSKVPEGSQSALATLGKEDIKL